MTYKPPDPLPPEALAEADACVGKIDLTLGEAAARVADVHPAGLTGGFWTYRPHGVMAVGSAPIDSMIERTSSMCRISSWWMRVSSFIGSRLLPSAPATHFVISAALGLRAQVGDLARIRALRILTPDIDDADRPNPRSGLEGKFSFQYAASVALLDGRVGINSFTD